MMSRPLICYACQQLDHMARDCPNLNNARNNENRNNLATAPQTNTQIGGGSTAERSPQVQTLVAQLQHDLEHLN